MQEQKMLERIVLAPGINGTELMKNLALHGKNCINLRIVNTAELSKIILMRAGILTTENFLGAQEENILISKAVEGEEYFGNPSYSDITQITAAVRKMRQLITGASEEESLQKVLAQGTFKKKNDALFHVYQKYMSILQENEMIDGVALARKAISQGRPIDAEFYCFKEVALTPLDKELLEMASGGSYQEIKLQEFFQINQDQVDINSFYNCYGAPNEVETVLTDIFKGKKLDQTTVAVTDVQTYSQLFYDYALLYDLPVTFGCGVPIMNSNPAKLLVLYYHWITDGFYDAASLKEMIFSKAFDSGKLYDLFQDKQNQEEKIFLADFCDVMGALRLTDKADVNEQRVNAYKEAVAEEESLIKPENEKAYKEMLQKKKYIPWLETMAVELALPAEEFITKYAKIRKGSATNAEKMVMLTDMSAASAIFDELTIINSSNCKQSKDDIILNVLKCSVCVQSSMGGALHVTDIRGAMGSVRDNLYIVGMSAGNFPGSPSENYLLLDTDLSLFGEGAETLTSTGKVINKKDQLEALVHLASGLGSTISVSYAGMNVSELKRDNASSLIYELFCEQVGKNVEYKELEKKIVNVAYFEPAISVTRNIGMAYNEDTKVLPDTPEQVEREIRVNDWNRAKAYSPSTVNDFFSCPRKFMLSYILRIAEPQEKGQFEVITAAMRGTLAHSLIEALANSAMSKEEFLELTKQYFRRYIALNPPLLGQSVDATLAELLEMMGTAYDMDPHRKVVLAEKELYCEDVCGVGVGAHGYPDCVEELEDGRLLIVDYKTGSEIKHIQDDIHSCLQVVIYAYLMEQEGHQVAGGEFRYLRLGEVVTCKYDEEMKELLKIKLNDFKVALAANYFPVADTVANPDACKYCKYGGICGKN